MSIEYAEDKDLQAMVEDSIKKFRHFEPLRDIGVIVLSLMKINMDNNGENKRCKGWPVTTKRVGPAERYYIKDNAHFILIMDHTTWNECNEKQRGFYVHHGLKLIKAERGEKKITIATQKPEYAVFADTVEAFGPVFDWLLTYKDVLMHGARALTVVDDLAEKVENSLNSETEVPEPEPDLPPPRRAKKVRAESE